MSEFGDMIGGRLVARVVSIDAAEGIEDATIYVQLEENQEDSKKTFVTLKNADASELELGSIVLLSDYSVELAPRELWAAESWVGVVRIKGPRETVIRRGDGKAVPVPTRTDVEYEAGNTVRARDEYGVEEVISTEPLPSVDLTITKDSEVDVKRFKEQDSSEQDAGGRPTFEDFGGMPSVVERARDLIEVPLKYKDALSEIGARPIKGVLFTGPPGTGKTLLARIIAREAKSAFYTISGPTVFTKWFGESEETLRRIFKDAEEAEEGSAIIFFDEIDSVASARGATSHETTRSVVAQLLTLMDGFKPNSNVIVIAATNRRDDIDPALRRPGRFDWKIEFPTPDEQDREAILRASSRHLKTDVDLSHSCIAQDTRDWSAAELAAIWSEAALVAAKDGRRTISDEDYFIGFEEVQEQKQQGQSSSPSGNA